MHIAIVGAGFAGLSAAWFCQKISHIQVDLFDRQGIGAGASGIAAGLLHPYVGEEGKRSQEATEAINEAIALIRAVEGSLNQCVMRHGIVRYLPEKEQQKTFELHEKTYADVKRLSEDRFFIESGYTVDCPLYIKGLWSLLEKGGARLHIRDVVSTQELLKEGYDAVVIAAGKGSQNIAGIGEMKASLVKGQVLYARIPCGLMAPEMSLVGKGYIATGMQERACILGSTYEKIQNPEPDLAMCRNYLMPRLLPLFSDIEKLEIIEAKAAFRVCMKGHYFPLLRKESDRVWTLTGLGSRGLLYHALLGKRIAERIGS